MDGAHHGGECAAQAYHQVGDGIWSTSSSELKLPGPDRVLMVLVDFDIDLACLFVVVVHEDCPFRDHR